MLKPNFEEADGLGIGTQTTKVCSKMYIQYLHNFNRRLSILRKARTDLDQNSRIRVHTYSKLQSHHYVFIRKLALCLSDCNTQGPLIKVKLSVQDRLASIVFNHVVGEIRNSLFNFPFSENAMCYIVGQIWNYKRQYKLYFFLTTYLCNKRYIRIR